MEPIDDITKEFLGVAFESLNQLDQDMIALEDSRDDTDRFARMFRRVHTIGRTSVCLEFPNLAHVTSNGENFLVALRDGELELTDGIARGLHAMIRAARLILENIESKGTEGEPAEQLLARLDLPAPLLVSQGANR